MKIIIPLAIASTLLLSACTQSPESNDVAQAPVTEPAAESATAPEAEPASAPSHSYQCESGETITAIYPNTDSATIEYKGTSYDMQIDVSGSGARYVGGEFEWWTKGSEGTLLHHLADGTSGENIELCTES